MATETYDVVNTDVYPYLPFNTSTIGASSAVTPDNITTYITQGASLVTGALGNSGVGYTALSDEQKQAVTDTIIQYAVAQTLLELGMRGGVYQAAQKRSADSLAMLRVSPNVIGVSATTARSNIDTDDPRTRKFNTRDW